MATYTLGSNGLCHAPGIVAWAINGASFKADRAVVINVIASTWKIPEKAAKALCLKEVPYTVVEGDGVQFVFPAK